MSATPVRFALPAGLVLWALLPSPVVGGELRGRVTSSGRPAAGVTVAAVPWESPQDAARRAARGTPAPATLASTTTRPDGSFSLALTPEAARVVLRVDGAGFVPVRLSGLFDGGPDTNVGDVRAAEASPLSGRVVDARGAAVPGAALTLDPGVPPFAGDELLAEPATTRSAADGSFRFERASSSGNRLRIDAAGFASANVAGVRAGVLAKPVALGPETILTGRVHQADGRTPAAAALVRFEGASVTPWTEAGPDGSFRLAGVPAAPGRVVADAGALGRAERAVRGAAPGGALALVLARPAGVSGRIVEASSGQPVPRARILAHGDGGSVVVERAGPDGRYRLLGLAPGRYRVKADEPRHVPYERDDVRVEAGAMSAVDLPLALAATLSGRVVDAQGAPVAGASGRLSRGASSRFGGLPFRRDAEEVAFRTGPDGTFKAERLAPGANQQLTVFHPEYERRLLAGLSLPAGGAKTGLTVVLRKGLELTGVVVDAEGRPLNGAGIEVRPSASERSGRGGGFMIELGGRRNPDGPLATSGADGRFRAAGLSPGTYSVHAHLAGHADASQDPVRVEREEPTPVIELKLGAGASISGYVRRNDGSGAKGYLVRARPEGGGDGGGPFGAGPIEPTGFDGAFVIDGLRAGESYGLMVLGPTGPGPRQAGVKAPAGDVEIVVGGAGRIAGRVIDATSREPLPEFTVAYEPELAQGGPMMRMVRAPRRLRRLSGDDDNVVRSPDGAFVLEDVPAGTWTVTVEAPGYETARIGDVAVRDSDTTSDLEIRATKGRSIRGRVIDARSGRPVVGATVAADESGGARPPMPPGLEDAAAYTDADGAFDVPGLALGTWKLVARHPDYAEASQLVELRQNVADAQIRMSSGGDLGGFIVSEAGAPVGGASVAVRAGGEGGGFRMGPGPGMGLSGSSTLSDDAGHFRFDRLAAGRYSVTASLRGRTSASLDVPLQAGESREDLRVALAAGATLHGRVSGLDASRYGSVNVTASGPESYFAGVRPGGDGTFTLGGVPDGAIELHAMAGDFENGVRTATAQVQIAQGQADADAEIVFEPGASLAGTVTRGGEGVDGATLMASAPGQGGPGSFARTDASGGYRLEGLKDGSYSVTATPPRGAAKRQSVEVAGDATLDFVLPLARLAGRVVEAGSSLPLAEAEVEVDSSASGGGMGRSRPRASTDSNGRFAIEGVEPGSSTLTSRRTGYVYDRRTVEATEDTTRDIEIELKRGEGLGLRARDGNYGVPLHALLAQARDASGAVVFGGPLSLDSDGRGEVPSLKAGSYSLRLDASGYAPLTLTVSVPSPTLDVMLTAGGALDIRCGPETQARGPRARLVDGAGTPVGQGPFGSDGWFALAGPVRTFAHLAPGSYTLSVEGGPMKAVAVTEGGAAVIDLP